MYRFIINSIDGLRKRKGDKELAEKREHSPFYHLFLIPFYSGIAGFASFLFIVLFIELILYLTRISDSLDIGIIEVMIAGLGFILQFVYEFLHQKKRS